MNKFTIASAFALALFPAMSAIADSAALPLVPTRSFEKTVSSVTWMQLDLSPDGKNMLIDVLGDIYVLDATGGEAKPVLAGMAFERNPVFSPDGTKFAFISDRSGVTNLWVANADGSNLRQISHDSSLVLYSSPAWSPDGHDIYVSRAVHKVLAFELMKFSADGSQEQAGKGEAVVKAQPTGAEDWDNRTNAMGAVISPDGKFVYYATKLGHTWTEGDPPNWSIARRDLATGAVETVVQSAGGAMRPVLSHNGRFLAYASRKGPQTGLRLRDFQSGEDRWVAYPVDHDGQEGGYYADLMPRYVFTPDDKALLMGAGGGIKRLDIASGKMTEVAFKVPVKLGLGPLTRVTQREETGPVKVRVIQEPSLSPDGKRIIFTAMGALYKQNLEDGAQPVKLVNADAFQPAWSPDGKTIAFVRWNAKDGGHIWTMPIAGGKPKRLTAYPDFYTSPTFSPDGASVVALRANQFDRLHMLNEISPDRASDIIRIPLNGGTARTVTRSFGALQPHFSKDGRLWFYGPAGLSVVSPAGVAKPVAQIVALPMGQYIGVPLPVAQVRVNPAGDKALVRTTASQLYLVDLPTAGSEASTINVSESGKDHVKLTNIGADFFNWSADGSSISWSVGSTYRRIATDVARRGETGAGETLADRFAVNVQVPRDVPQGKLVLRGATVMTMRGDEVIADADIVIADNRIAAVGKRGSVIVPDGAVIRDVTGRYIVPGFVDAHAHWFEIRRNVHDVGHWDFAANLAYGVTSGLEVQPFTTDIFAYQDMIEAGMMPGPRAWTTGPGIFNNSEINSRQDAVDVLTRYREHYRTRNIKSYMVGDRAARQYIVQGAAELGMMPTTEGASDLVLGLTHAIDGFSGNEHSLPVSPLYDDIISLYAQSRTSYTPTLSVLYGGGPALFDYIINKRPQDDPKFRHFVPRTVIAEKLRNRHWMPAEAQTYARFAADALKIQRAGGLVAMGSHGELQGLGMHWEMEAYASGGAAPMEAIHAATMGSAETIGHAGEVGSIEPGKFADLVILTDDPRVDIKNTQKIDLVMKNGRLYDDETLDEIWPQQSKQPENWFAGENDGGK